MESVITECPYICAPNIMDTPDFSTKMVQLDMSGGSCIKAGTPISADGKVANDETAIGILLNDCHSCLGNARGLVVIGGRIKQDVAKNHSGITISDKAKAAMINVTFTGDGARAGGGGGTITRLVKTGNTATREDGSAITPQEALDAFLAGPVLLKTNEDQGHASWHTIVDVFFDTYASTLTTISLAYLSLQTSTQRERVTIST